MRCERGINPGECEEVLMEKETGISKKVEEFLQVFRKGEEFTQELLK